VEPELEVVRQIRNKSATFVGYNESTKVETEPTTKPQRLDDKSVDNKSNYCSTGFIVDVLTARNPPRATYSFITRRL